MSHVRENSEAGGRLIMHIRIIYTSKIYRNIKSDLATESYVANKQAAGVRRVLADLMASCLPLGIETGWSSKAWPSSGPATMLLKSITNKSPAFLCMP